MILRQRISIAAAIISTAGALAAWAGTGMHHYTKYKVVETVEEEIPADDPLAGTGFYDGSTQQKTVERDEFHLGLLPTPQGLFDRHILSVATIVVPFWGFFGLLAWRSRRRGRR